MFHYSAVVVRFVAFSTHLTGEVPDSVEVHNKTIIKRSGATPMIAHITVYLLVENNFTDY